LVFFVALIAGVFIMSSSAIMCFMSAMISLRSASSALACSLTSRWYAASSAEIRSARLAAIRRIAPCNPARVESIRLSRMNGYRSNGLLENELYVIHEIIRTTNENTKGHEPMPCRIASAARSPNVRSSPDRTAGWKCQWDCFLAIYCVVEPQVSV